MTACVLWLFLTVPWVGLQCAIVIIPDHARILFVAARMPSSATECGDQCAAERYRRQRRHMLKAKSMWVRVWFSE